MAMQGSKSKGVAVESPRVLCPVCGRPIEGVRSETEDCWHYRCCGVVLHARHDDAGPVHVWRG